MCGGLFLASMSPVTGGYLDIEIFGCFDIWIIGYLKKYIGIKSKDKRACVRGLLLASMSPVTGRSSNNRSNDLTLHPSLSLSFYLLIFFILIRWMEWIKLI